MEKLESAKQTLAALAKEKKDGKLGEEEYLQKVHAALQEAGIKVTQEELTALVKAADAEGISELDLDAVAGGYGSKDKWMRPTYHPII